MIYVFVVLLIGLLIFVHELGHFVAARLVGMPVSRLSLGFGPRLWSAAIGRTEYRLCAFPLGGYVLLGFRDFDSLLQVPAWKRLVFYLGGPLANVLLVLPLFAVINVAARGFSLDGVLVQPFSQTGQIVQQLLAALPGMFSHSDSVAGVLGIVVEGGAFIGGNLTRGMQFAIFLSLNLAILNLLPLPILDGGRIVLLAVERLIPQPRRVHIALALVGWLLVVSLMAYATALDVGRYWSG